MKRTETVRVEVEQTVVVEIRCNCCGEALTKDDERFSFDGTFGYFSRFFGDMNRVEFDVCEKCLHDFTKTFKIPPNINDMLGGSES